MDDGDDEFRCETIDTIEQIKRREELINSIEEFYHKEENALTAKIGYYPEEKRTKGWSPHTFNTKIFEKFRYESPLLSGYFPRVSKENASFLLKFGLRVRLIPNEDVMFLQYSMGPQWHIEKIPDRTDGYRHFFHRMFVKDFPSLYPDSGLKNIFVDISYGIRDHVLVERDNDTCIISNVYSVPAVRTYSCTIKEVTNTNMAPVAVLESDYYTKDERPVTIPVTNDDLYNILIEEDSSDSDSDSDSDENVNSLSQLSIGPSSSELLVLEKEPAVQPVVEPKKTKPVILLHIEPKKKKRTVRTKKSNNKSIFKVPDSIIKEALKDMSQTRLPFKPVVKSSVPKSAVVKKPVIKKKRAPVQTTLSPFFRKPSKSSRLSSSQEDEENEEQ